jgi:hypothetical protein
MNCQNCSKELGANSKFCRFCGSPQTHLDRQDEQTTAITNNQTGTREAKNNQGSSTSLVAERCSSCSAEIKTGQLFCTSCGSQIPQEPTESASLTEEGVNDSFLHCPQCGGAIKVGQIFCTSCGGKLELAQMEEGKVSQEEETRDQIACATCGKAMTEGAACEFCDQVSAAVEDIQEAAENLPISSPTAEAPLSNQEPSSPSAAKKAKRKKDVDDLELEPTKGDNQLIHRDPDNTNLPGGTSPSDLEEDSPSSPDADIQDRSLQDGQDLEPKENEEVSNSSAAEEDVHSGDEIEEANPDGKPSKKKRSLGAIIGAVVLLAATVSALTLTQPSNLEETETSDNPYQSCEELRADFPTGVGRVGAVDQPPLAIREWETDDEIYRQNVSLDPDRDGIACEITTLVQDAGSPPDDKTDTEAQSCDGPVNYYRGLVDFIVSYHVGLVEFNNKYKPLEDTTRASGINHKTRLEYLETFHEEQIAAFEAIYVNENIFNVTRGKLTLALVASRRLTSEAAAGGADGWQKAVDAYPGFQNPLWQEWDGAKIAVASFKVCES